MPRRQKRRELACQVDGCDSDLTVEVSEYRRRHRVCSKCLKADSVTVHGCTSRWCQQCTKFHPLSAFEGSKRSCRERLHRHNKRRRNMAASEEDTDSQTEPDELSSTNPQQQQQQRQQEQARCTTAGSGVAHELPVGQQLPGMGAAHAPMPATSSRVMPDATALLCLLQGTAVAGSASAPAGQVRVKGVALPLAEMPITPCGTMPAVARPTSPASHTAPAPSTAQEKGTHPVAPASAGAAAAEVPAPASERVAGAAPAPAAADQADLPSLQQVASGSVFVQVQPQLQLPGRPEGLHDKPQGLRLLPALKRRALTSLGCGAVPGSCPPGDQLALAAPASCPDHQQGLNAAPGLLSQLSHTSDMSQARTSWGGATHLAPAAGVGTAADGVLPRPASEPALHTTGSTGPPVLVTTSSLLSALSTSTHAGSECSAVVAVPPPPTSLTLRKTAPGHAAAGGMQPAAACTAPMPGPAAVPARQASEEMAAPDWLEQLLACAWQGGAGIEPVPAAAGPAAAAPPAAKQAAVADLLPLQASLDLDQQLHELLVGLEAVPPVQQALHSTSSVRAPQPQLRMAPCTLPGAITTPQWSSQSHMQLRPLPELPVPPPNYDIGELKPHNRVHYSSAPGVAAVAVSALWGASDAPRSCTWHRSAGGLLALPSATRETAATPAAAGVGAAQQVLHEQQWRLMTQVSLRLAGKLPWELPADLYAQLQHLATSGNTQQLQHMLQ